MKRVDEITEIPAARGLFCTNRENISSFSSDSDRELGDEIYKLVEELFPLHRSITGDGVRQSLSVILRHIPDLNVQEIPTGTQCFDWTIPDEWNIREAYIADDSGDRIVDIQDNNLHVVSYSVSVEKTMTLSELNPHLHSREDMPDAIPYITSYYNRRWGFCLSDTQRKRLSNDKLYYVKIDSSHTTGSLTYADLIIPGESSDEILISTYVCHPSMANNETSGMAVATFLAKFVKQLPQRKYTYRFVFVPETIGAVAYISENLNNLKTNVVAGLVITCVGDDRQVSFLPSKKGDSVADRAARHVLKQVFKLPYKNYSFLDRGSDERQYCSPGVDLDVVSLMRTKYGAYPEYHTSLDNLDLVSPQGLFGGYCINKTWIECLEINETLRAKVPCEPFMSPRGLRPPLIDGIIMSDWSRTASNILAYADGTLDLIQMADIFEMSIFEVAPIAKKLKECGLLVTI